MNGTASIDLPVRAALPALRTALREHGTAVLEAPPGAGKSTLVPLALLDEEYVRGKRIVMLEPRRLATRGVATFMARQHGDAVGATVGYRIRFENRTGARTRIEVVTEGILTRRIQNDPELRDVGLLIFDEFHERHLQGDLALALALEARGALREDLRILVMSATLEGVAARVARHLGDAPIIQSAGRVYPLEVTYSRQSALQERTTNGIVRAVAPAVQRTLRESSGDILVFLPGAGEIRRLSSELDVRSDEVVVFPLYGELSQSDQDAALAPDARGRRKVILATPLAETSLTIDGVRVVIDSGLCRVPRYDPASGLERLELVPISRAQADQRAGRAARQAPGQALRLWTTHEHERLPLALPAEITQTDLTGLLLECAAWGIVDPRGLPFLDAPPEAALARARELLTQLDALHADGTITEAGRAMVRWPVHPRLGRMLYAAPRVAATAQVAPDACVRLAADLAALLGERDLLRGPMDDEAGSRGPGPRQQPTRRSPYIEARLQILRDFRAGRGVAQATACRAVDRAATQIRQLAARDIPADGSAPAPAVAEQLSGILLAMAYPDRVGLARGGDGRYLLAGGRGAVLTLAAGEVAPALIVAPVLDGTGADAPIRLAAPLARADLENFFAADIVERQRVYWDGDRVRAVSERVFAGTLVLSSRELAKPDDAQFAAALLDGVRQLMREQGLAALPWDTAPDARQFQARVEFLRRHGADLAELSDEWLKAHVDEWLAPHLVGLRKKSDLEKLDMTAILRARYTWAEQQLIETRAPTHITVPSGSNLRLRYEPHTGEGEVVLPVKLQEMFGLADTPRVADGRVPVTLHLLSPAGRPIQITRDLRGFWDRTYLEVKKELRGRYPRHPWPDDPWTATATRFTKRRAPS